MSDLQGESSNFENRTTAIVADTGWYGLNDLMLNIHAPGVLGGPAPSVTVDGLLSQGHLDGVGVIGWGGQKRGTGVVGLASVPENPPGGTPPPPSGRGKNVGVYGLGGDVGVLGETSGGDADGVRGFGSGNFSGVAGFGDPKGNSTGVFGKGASKGVFGIGEGVAAPGVLGIGTGGPNTAPANPCGVYGQGGSGTANGVEGHGGSQGAGVAGFGDLHGSGPGVLGVAHGPGAAGVKGIGSGAGDTPTISACGVYGQAGSGVANGVEGRGGGNFAGVAGFGDVSVTANSGIGVFAVGGPPRTASGQPGGPGVHALGFGAPPFSQLSQCVGVFGMGGVGDAPGVLGQGSSAIADGVRGFSDSGSAINGQAQSGVGVRAFSSSGTAVVAEGDQLVPGTIGIVATGHTFAGQFNGNVLVNGAFTVNGKKSAAVPFPDGSYRRLYCMESPESWFEDFGFGELANGEAQVRLDPDFASTVDNESYHVFITEYGDNNALYVAKRTSEGFVVRAKGAKANGRFGYRIVAKRNDIAAPRFEEVAMPKIGLRVNDSREGARERR